MGVSEGRQARRGDRLRTFRLPSLLGALLSVACLLGATPTASASLFPQIGPQLWTKHSPAPKGQQAVPPRLTTASASRFPQSWPLPSPKPSPAPQGQQAAPPPPTTGWLDPSNVRDFAWLRIASGSDPVFDPNGYNTGLVGSQLQRIRNLGADIVRFDIWVSTVGYPQPYSFKLTRIDQLVAQASSIGLRVHFGLFAGFSNYSDTQGSATWLAAILGRYKNDPRIAFAEVGSEVNLASNQSQMMAWLRQMIPVARQAGGQIPVAVSIGGWCPGTAPLASLKNGLASTPPDIYQYHYYCDPGIAYAVLRDAISTVAPASLMVGETGYTTMVNNPDLYVYNSNQAVEEALQMRFYELVETATRLLHLAPAAPWTDGDMVPSACPTCMTAERYFGLYRTDGTAKPAAAVIRAAFTGAAIPNDDNFGFEEDGGGFPKFWQVMDNHGKFATDTSVARSGVASLRMSQTTHNSQTGATPGVYLEPENPPVPGQAYTLGAWVRGGGATGHTFVIIAWLNENQQWMSYTESQLPVSGTTPWLQLIVTATAPSGAAAMQIFLGSRDNAGTVWFDDVTLSPAL